MRVWRVGDVEIDHPESEVAYSCEQAVHGRVVHQLTGEDGLHMHVDVVEHGSHVRPDRAPEPDEYLLHDRRPDARGGLSVSGPRCDGDTGTDTNLIMDDEWDCVIAPMV